MIFFRLLNTINKKTNNRFYLFLGVLINIVITHIIIQNDMIFLNNNNAHPVYYLVLYIAIFVCVIITNILVFMLIFVSYIFISWFKNELLTATKEAIVEEFNIKSDKISDKTKSKSKITFK